MADLKNVKDDETPARPLGPKFTEAFEFARIHHLLQGRKGTDGVPYLSHLMAVASIALEHEATEDEAIAALLHDVVEDGGTRRWMTSATRIRRRRGGDRAGSSEDREGDPSWCKRKRAYIESLKTKSEPALLVSAADKLHNARATLADHYVFGDKLWEPFTVKDPVKQLCYYRGLANEFTARADSDAPRIKRLAEELERTVAELERRPRG